MGHAPDAAKAEDLVCGCKTPVLIRRVGDHHVLVGDCYMYSIMNGELMKEPRDTKYPSEVFRFE